MGGTPEQPDGDSRGNRLERIGVQLTETTTEQDLSEAEEEIASAFSLPNLPTVEQQIRAIEAPIQARYADEIALDPEVVDEILRTGSNRSKGQLRLIYNFMVEKTPEEYTEFVKNEYGTGGKGFEIGGAKYAVWFDDLGLRIAAGSTVRSGTIANAFLSWEDVSNRIHELLRQGEYAPQAVLDAARQNALQEHAQTLAYMERDLADGVAEAVFQDTEIFRGGFPELTDRLAGLLDDTNFLTDLNDRLSALGEAYAEDKDLMWMHFYKPDKVAALFHQFAKPYQNYSARDGFHWNEYKKFITEDEINAYFTRGSNYSDSRLAIYSFFLNHEDKKERADFLKEHYGIGGSSHALCGADDSHEDHDGRGIALERGSYLILDEGGYQVAGQKGTWMVSDEVEVDGQRFVQMRSEQTKNSPPSIILHESGAFVTQTALGFDGEATRKMRAFLQGPKPELLHHQKFFENGTAERAKESGTEQNYNMIDGCVNNVPKKPRRIGGRWSVLDRLHIKQAERRQKDNAPQQEQERSRKN